MLRRPRAQSSLLPIAGVAAAFLLIGSRSVASAPLPSLVTGSSRSSPVLVAGAVTPLAGSVRPLSARLLPPGDGRAVMPPDPDPLTGPRSRLDRDWIGLRPLPADTEILLLAGHADSQNMAGSGTPGEAVALRGAAPMVPGVSDELFWNLQLAHAVLRLGQERGLPIRYHAPPFRTMPDGNAPGTNWSVGRDHVAAGGYALELHFDAYGPDGIGSGLIPPVHRPPSHIDESLAQEFGDYPLRYRNILGGPRRGIALLEIGKLEGVLEASLRDPITRQATLNTIAERVVRALERGLGRLPVDVTPAAASADSLQLFERPARR